MEPVPAIAFWATWAVVVILLVGLVRYKILYDKLYDKWSSLVNEHTDCKLDLSYAKRAYRKLRYAGNSDEAGRCKDIW